MMAWYCTLCPILMTNEPIPFVHLYSNDQKKHIISDSLGTVTFYNIIDDTLNVRVLGYHDKKITEISTKTVFLTPKIATLKEVIVNFPSTTTLTVNSTLAACGSANLGNAITNFDSSGNTTYTFYDPSNNVITSDAASNITVGGNYSIEAQLAGDICPSVRQTVAVTINALPSIVVTNPQESVNVGTNVTLEATSTAPITWFDPQGNPLTGPTFTTGPLNTPGVYTYTAVANDGTCTATATK